MSYIYIYIYMYMCVCTRAVPLAPKSHFKVDSRPWDYTISIKSISPYFQQF